MTEHNTQQTAADFLQVSDAQESQEFLAQQAIELNKKLDQVSDQDSLKRAEILLSLANAELGMQKMQLCWEHARQAFDRFIQHEQWESAVEACDILYQTELPSAVSALGHGAWLAVTFPVSVQHSINMLNYIINETPDNADGAALAAIVAHYVVDLRCEGKQREDYQFMTTNMIARVAKRHSNVETQAGLDAWMEKLQLRDPNVFLPRFGLVLGAIVENNWWFDRDKLREKIPEN